MVKKVVKRDGRIVDFCAEKISNAVLKAMKECGEEDKELSKKIAKQIQESEVDVINLEDVQNSVEDKLMESKRKDVARAYVRYRYKRELVRETNTTDKSILELLDGDSEYWNRENSNKDAKLVTTQRDYIAGITSTDIARRMLLPKDVVEAHDEGIIHVHDMDYYAERTRTNCSLINLEDMLQNGTVVNGKMIEKPHKLLTAMTITTQIITAVASSQYGGCSITLAHLAPFVRDSYNKYVKKYTDRGLNEEQIIKFAKDDLKEEIDAAVQTFNYQINSMSTTNGQQPFVSVFMYLSEDKEYTEEIAMLIEEFFRQRLLGIKNEKGVYVTQAFPKLLYVLEEDNVHEDSKYWYLTKLAAKCISKRMAPDIISEKKMFELKEGNCFPCINKTCA